MSHTLFYLTQKCRAIFERWTVKTLREQVDKLRAELLMFQKGTQPGAKDTAPGWASQPGEEPTQDAGPPGALSLR